MSERHGQPAVVLGWEPKRIVSWCLALASDEVEHVRARAPRSAGFAFPLRAPELAAMFWSILSPGERGLAGSP